MAERSTVSQGVQIGPEGTYGTATDADTRLSALSIMPAPDPEFQQFRPAGNKFNTISALIRDTTTADLEGALTYTEIVYPFSSIFGAASITTPVGATNGRQHEYVVAATAADAPVSYTVQRGDGTLLEAFSGFVVNTLDINMAVGEGITISGDGFGKAMAHSASAMDAVTTTVALVPVLPTQISVYVDDLPATLNEANIDGALGTTKLTRVFEANLSFGNRYSQVYALDAAVAGSSVAIVEVPVDFQVELVMEADATGWGLKAAAAASTPKLIRIEATGAEVEAGVDYSFIVDVFGQIVDGGETDDRDGVEQISWTFDQMYSSDWTRAMRARVVNAIAAL